MNQEINDVILIRKLLHGELTQNEKDNLKSRARFDETFRDLIERENQIFTAFRRVKRKEGRNQLNGIEQSLKDNTRKSGEQKIFSIFKKLNTIKIAASFTVIAALAVILFLLYSTSSFKRIYVAQLNETKFDPGWNLRGSNDNKGEVFWQKFKDHYNNENYHEAIMAFEKIEDKLLTKTDSLTYGYSLLSVGKNKESIAIFNQLNSKRSIFSERLEWYTALCLMELKQKDSAIKLLINISNDPEHDFKNNAKKILESL